MCVCVHICVHMYVKEYMLYVHIPEPKPSIVCTHVCAYVCQGVYAEYAHARPKENVVHPAISLSVLLL